MCGFNPRSREGATFTADREDRAILVSIHAPAKERHYLQFLFYAKNEFQSTLPRRSDKSCTGATEREDMFQSTLPRRSDTISLRADRGLRSFNPRSREGATHSEQSNNKRIVFQSTLPRRSDGVLLYKNWDTEKVSIHAPAKERLHLPPIFFLQHTIFSHILHKSYFSKSSNQLR